MAKEVEHRLKSHVRVVLSRGWADAMHVSPEDTEGMCESDSDRNFVQDLPPLSATILFGFYYFQLSFRAELRIAVRATEQEHATKSRHTRFTIQYTQFSSQHSPSSTNLELLHPTQGVGGVTREPESTTRARGIDFRLTRATLSDSLEHFVKIRASIPS